MAKNLDSKGSSARPFDVTTHPKGHHGSSNRTRHKGKRAMKSRFAYSKRG